MKSNEIGDFNEVCYSHEKLRGRPIKVYRANLLLDCMLSCGMIDVGFVGQKFTWSNKRRVGPIMERLDRSWDNVDWMSLFPSAIMKVLPRLTSDHFPILLTLVKPNDFQKPKPFLFEPMWCLNFSFACILNVEWSKSEKLFFEKLIELSPVLDSWNKNVFGNVFKKKARILVRIEGIQKYQGNQGFSIFLFDLEASLQEELMSILHQEELLWMMKARDSWLADGDKNTPYFHKFVLVRRKKNRILSLTMDVGEDTFDPN